ncbi:uncharacterized protein LOC117373425 isoform X2 [Periophthalmus magnuspinnatus]|uniref:uncharacterized protein LOC117373425 isoform X2 n=1 Tax=Periophthalmus magnuspinnatus TaxID=409849 RepID=UPI00145B7FD8|nr:uncharacterized protein LOC117373425 isoform X2 [Periophthalmus magnuspinnatus]
MSDSDMGENEDSNQWESPFKNLLLLGAIAAASAFVVTILIVLVCVGCQRKSKSKHPPAGEKGTSVNMQGTLRHPKLNSMSKSDTRLHEINRFPCNGNFSKSRPASMDLLLLHSRRSQTDLRPSHGRQLPQIPTSPPGSGQDSGGETGGDPEAGLVSGVGGGEARDHTYTEVGVRNNPTPTHALDDGLYETVGVREGEAGHKVPSAPPSILSNSPASVRAAQSPSAQANGARGGNSFGNNGRGNGRLNGGNGTMPGRGNNLSGMNRSPLSSVNSLTNQEPGGVEYASVRKFRKVEKSSRKENNGGDSQSDQSSVSDSPSAPPLHRSQEFPRKPLEPFHIHSFPKEAVFMGNGEQYIWKPPEDDDIITLHPPPHCGDNGQAHPSPPTAKEIAETYSIVCKNQRKKPPMENNGAKTLPRSFGGGRGKGRGVQVQARSQEEPCYEPVGSWSTCATAESDASYATVDSHRKREQLAGNSNSSVGGSATLKRKKPQQQQQQAALPAATPAQGSGPSSLPVRGLPGGEHFYESISDVKAGANSASTTTIFTFNDGMEMYVTGL